MLAVSLTGWPIAEARTLTLDQLAVLAELRGLAGRDRKRKRR
jgi:hypothetical protein